ncbi:hypothetical protein PYV61_21775, partial [Roseisolibacter sp. H3M3-2]
DAAPGADGVRRIVRGAGPDGLESLDELARAAAALPRVLFVGHAQAPAPAVLVATSEDSGLDAGAMLRAALAAHGGKGGGSPRLAQGRAADVDGVVALLLGDGGERGAA